MRILPELESFCFKTEPINYSELLSFLLLCAYYSEYFIGYIEFSPILYTKIIECDEYSHYI